MPATSNAQRRLFGMVLAAKRGQLRNPSAKVKKIASGISEQSAADFATKKKRQTVTKSLMTGKSGY
jgi:hypothetical protein